MENLDQTYKRLLSENKKEEICKGCGEKMSNCSCNTVEEAAESKKKPAWLIAAEKRAEKKEGKVVKEGSNDIPPFDMPYSTVKKTVTDKSGAKHGPMSRARDLARSSLNKHLNATYTEYNPEKDKLKKQHFGMAEEVEQIDELSKGTIGSYIKKATTDSTISRKIATDFEHRAKRSKKQDMKDANTSVANQFKDKSWKRQDNIGKAVDRLTKEEVEYIDEANHRDYACAGCMHPTMAKHMEVGQHTDYYEPKTGNKVHGKVMHKSDTEVHMKQTHDSYDDKKVGSVHKFKIKNSLDESKWIQGAIKHPGAETAAAKRAGMSTHEYMEKHKHDSGKAGKRARLGLTLSKINKEETEQVDEVLKPSMGAGAYIDDFVHSKNPKFAGKSKEMRRQMALGAYYKAKKEMKEQVELEEGTITFDNEDEAKAMVHKLHHNNSSGHYDGNYHHGVKNRTGGKKYEIEHAYYSNHTVNKEIKRLQNMKEEVELDESTEMSRLDLQTIINHVERLKPLVDKEMDLPDWIESKITMAADYIGCVADYVEAAEQLGTGLEESTRNVTPTVKTNKYSWGTMKTIHHGSSFSIPLHPEHHEKIADMKDQQQHTIKTEDGRQYHVKREGDTVHFHGVNGGNKTSVPHKSLAEETQVDEAWVLRQKKKEKKPVKEETVKSFKDFITEMEFDKNGRYVNKGKYGTSYDDPEGKEDNEKPAAEKAEKRGRGRPAGAKSGARQIGGASKKGSGVEYTGYKLHLPNSNK